VKNLSSKKKRREKGTLSAREGKKNRFRCNGKGDDVCQWSDPVLGQRGKKKRGKSDFRKEGQKGSSCNSPGGEKDKDETHPSLWVSATEK